MGAMRIWEPRDDAPHYAIWNLMGYLRGVLENPVTETEIRAKMSLEAFWTWREEWLRKEGIR
jgi:hypothetical protein